MFLLFPQTFPADPAVSAHGPLYFLIIILNFSLVRTITQNNTLFFTFSCDFSPTFIRISGNICFVNSFPVNFAFSVFVSRLRKEETSVTHSSLFSFFPLLFSFIPAFASICRRLWISSSQISSSLFPSVSMIMSAAASYFHGACSSDLR